MFLTRFRNASEWGLMVAMIFGGGAIAQAQNDQSAPIADQTSQGKIVRIGPTGEDQIALDDQTIEPSEMPKHWIGILGGPVSDELRAQIDIPADQGVLVRQVVPASPADKAGLKSYDILLKANDTNLADVRELTDLVKNQGENGSKIVLDVLRRGQYKAITLTPEARPDDVAGVEPTLPGQGDPGLDLDGMGPGQQVFRFHRGGPMQFRIFGPGALPSQQNFNVNQMPNGVSVSIQKQNDEPAQITVQRGSDTWTVVGDDPSSLAQLPDDVRPFVEQLLAGGGRVQLPLPSMPNMPAMPNPPAGFHEDAMQQQLLRMEHHLQKMQQQLEKQFDQMQLTKPAENDSDEPSSK